LVEFLLVKASVTILGDEPVKFDADVLSIEEPLMELRTPSAVPLNAALRIDVPDAMWLGEVEAARADQDGFLIRVKLCHVLRDFDTLARLTERFGMAKQHG
jgi:hypothetical protein